VLNRGNGGTTVFHKAGDYAAFLDLLATAKAKHSVILLAICLMPNHFHLMLQLARDASLSPFMQWWMTSHVRRYHRHYHSHGHVWQGRFKSFPIQQDGHLLTVLRYVLRNPVRAKLVEHAREWPWSSLRFPHLLDPFPGLGPAESPHWLDAPLLKEELATLRTCVNRQQPFGTAAWQTRIAALLGLEFTLRARGRPRKPMPEK
jgi:putative transposase